LHLGLGGERKWYISATIRGGIAANQSSDVTWEFYDSDWSDGVIRGIQEATARLCEIYRERLAGTRFYYYGRRDADGRPTGEAHYGSVSYYTNHMERLLFNTQKELDRVRKDLDCCSDSRAEIKEKFEMMRKDRCSLRRNRTKTEELIKRLRKKIHNLKDQNQELKANLEEMEEKGEDLRKENALISDDDDYVEEMMDMEHEEEDDEIVDEEDSHEDLMYEDDEEEDPEEREFEKDEGNFVDLEAGPQPKKEY
jgi:chromosome segregation ATPase